MRYYKHRYIQRTSFLTKAGFCCCFGIMLCLWFLATLSVQAAPRLQDTGDELVIVIDPGHGGVKDFGTTSGNHQEKIMNLTTAQAMYDELSQFDNVEVYMTRSDDSALTLAERAEFAASVDADFLFSIHYNASENHTMFGSEVWVSCQPPYNAYGYQFATLQMQEMQDMGLFLRGIKTRIGDRGDYYGVIRESVALSVPAVIIEHCHVDAEKDIPFCDSEEDWIAFGKADARSVAKYFGLSSKSLGIDYSQESFSLPDVNENSRVQSTMIDETSPDVCMIELKNTNYDTGEIEIEVTATDYDSPLMYYSYSTDGGLTYGPLTPWPELDIVQGTYADTFSLSVKINSGVQPEIVVRAYNHADLFTESNHLPFLQAFYYDEQQVPQESVPSEEKTPSDRDRHSIGTTTFVPANLNMNEAAESEEEEVSILTFLKICLVFVIILFVVVLISQSIHYQRRKKRRRQRINDAGNSKNQSR